MTLAQRVADQFRTVKEIAEYYPTRPSQYSDLVRWVQLHGSTTLSAAMPWWPFPVIDFVDRHLPRGSRVLEFGGGGSTLWLLERGHQVTSVEHDQQWSEVLLDKVPAGHVVSVPVAASGEITSPVEPGFFDSYVAVADGFDDEALDLVIVDGRARVECGRRARPKVKRGGMLLLDDSDRERYLPLVGELGSWERRDFTGLKPGSGGPRHSSIFIRPAHDGA